MKRVCTAWSLASLLALLASGCQRDSHSYLTLSLEVETANSKTLGKDAILPGAVLHTRDTLALKLAVDKPAYIYVVSFPEATGPVVVTTGHEAQPLKPGELLRLPEEPLAFELKPPVGNETFFVAATSQRIDGDICRLWEFSCPATRRATGSATRGGNDPPPATTAPPPPPPPPKGLSGQTRDGIVQSVTTNRKVMARSDQSGIARIRFPYLQIP